MADEPGTPTSVEVDEKALRLLNKPIMKDLNALLKKHAKFEEFYESLHSDQESLD